MTQRARPLLLALMIFIAVPVMASEQRLLEPVRSFSLSRLLSSLFGNLLPFREISAEETPAVDPIPSESTDSGDTDGRGTLDPDG